MFAALKRTVTSLLALIAIIPAQLTAQVTINEVSSVQSDRLLKYPIGGLPSLGALPAWYTAEYGIPSWWSGGVGPIGFGASQATSVASMQGSTPVLYLKRQFTVTPSQAASASALELVIDYADGFVAYLNGKEVARRNTGAVGTFAWHNQQAFNGHGAGTPETISLGVTSTLLSAGTNVLAIQVHNNDVDDGQLYCSATLRIGGTVPTNLVNPGDSWYYFAGNYEPAGGLYDSRDFGASLPLGPNWTQSAYDDSTWSSGPGGFGFDTAPDYDAQIGTDLQAQMLNLYVGAYMRRSFSISQAEYDALTATSLTVDFDDGYVLYLNGYEVSRGGVSGAAGTFVPIDQYASSHSASRDNGGNNPAAIVSVSIPKNLLKVGNNIIAAQLHNATPGSSDLVLDVRFSGTSGANTLNFVALGSTWKYKIGNQEIGTPAPPNPNVPVPEFLDWLELKNAGAAAVNLGGWALTDDSGKPAKWSFPNGTTIASGGFLLVACSGRNVIDPGPGGLLHTNFSLKASGEYLALRNSSGAVQSELISVPDQDAFHTWGRDPGTGQYGFIDRGTPGAENNAIAGGNQAAPVSFDKDTGFYSSIVNLALSTQTSGASIRYTTDGSEPTETTGSVYAGPFNPTVQTSPGPGQGTILREMFQWSAGTVVLPANLPANASPTTSQLITLLETPSSISDYYTHRVRGYLYPPTTGSYEFWLATDDDGELWLSTNDSPANKQRIAYIQGNWAGSREWTKLATQHSTTRTLVAGQRYYIEVLQSEGSGGDNLAVGWSGPGLPSGINVIEGRYLAPLATLPPNTQQPPAYTTIRARAFAPGLIPSEVRTRNYVIGADARFSTVPAIFLSGPAGETFYAPNGCFSAVGGSWASGSWQAGNVGTDYNFALVRGDAFERPATLEFVKAGNQLVERTTVGARFAGSPWSRPQYRIDQVAGISWNSGWLTKPQMNVFFRSDFGISKLDIPGFIPGSRLNEWDELRFRAGKNDVYDPFIVDEFMRRSLEGTGQPAPLGYFSSLFINGQFKSYFNVTERPRNSFFKKFYNLSSDWDVQYNGEWEDGDGTAFSSMQTFFRNTDFTTLANYQQGAALWDMRNVADYFIINGWGATQDWPHNNFIFARERVTGGKWRFSMWDAEGAFGVFGQANTHNTFDTDLYVPENGSRPSVASDGVITRIVFRRAYQNAEFRLLFADRLQKHFFNGGAMTRPNMQARWDSLRNQVNPLVQAVFGHDANNGYWTNWANRDATFFSQCQSIGLWPTTKAPNYSFSGNSVLITNPNTSGTIYYTTNGSDPRAVGGATAGTVYGGGIAISAAFTIKARVLIGAVWSPLLEVPVALPPPKVVFTEINYNPNGSSDATEFIELTNVGGTPASLNGAHFTEGIDFTFGNVTLGVGQCIVLVKDSAAFAAAYPTVPIGGVFGGSLANEGETLTLRDLTENIICTVAYGDSTASGWPTTPDGDGSTLVLRRPFSASTNPMLGTSWRANGTTGGTPGSVDSTVFVGDPNADADQDGYNALTEYVMGTDDHNPQSIPHYYLSKNASGKLQVDFYRPEKADDVSIQGFESLTLGAWTPAVLQSDEPFGNGLMHSTWQSNATGPSLFIRFVVTQE